MTPIDIDGNPCLENWWYWAADSSGNVMGAGKFVIDHRDGTCRFYIGGTEHETEEFSRYAIADVPAVFNQ